MYKILLTAFTVGILLLSLTSTSFADRGYDNDHKNNKWHDDKDHKSKHFGDSRHSERGHGFHQKFITSEQLSPSKCETDNAEKVISINQKILNSVDSGVAGNNWAQDDYYRHIEVWQLDDGQFCAIAKYFGHFATFTGASPNGTGTVDAGIKGFFGGGYRTATFSATLEPTVPTHGYIGTFDYQCDISGDCPGFVDWTTLYFTDVSGFDLAWWGWQYQAGSHGNWVNSIDGNSGNIT